MLISSPYYGFHPCVPFLIPAGPLQSHKNKAPSDGKGHMVLVHIQGDVPKRILSHTTL